MTHSNSKSFLYLKVDLSIIENDKTTDLDGRMYLEVAMVYSLTGFEIEFIPEKYVSIDRDGESIALDLFDVKVHNMYDEVNPLSWKSVYVELNRDTKQTHIYLRGL